MSNNISTQYLYSSLRLSVSRMQGDLATAQNEATTGQYADVGLHLGVQAGQEISLQNENGLLQTYTTTNSAVATSLNTTKSALDTLRTNAQSALNNLTEWSGQTDSGSQLKDLGASGLQSLIATANTSVNGQYVFGGINSGAPPLKDYFAAPNAAQTAIQSAFSSYLSGLAPPATPATVTAAQLQTFIASPAFTGQFQEPAWSAATSNWSSASSTDITSNISPTETIASSTNANQTGFSQLAQAYTMLNEFTGTAINPAALQVVANQASSLIGQALNSLTTTEATIGSAQQRVTDANTHMSAQMNILQTQINSLDGADPYQTSLQVSSLTTQIQTAYSLTAQLQQLSLVKYL
jgi:flagellar hook-associated protein 3 FlgL